MDWNVWVVRGDNVLCWKWEISFSFSVMRLEFPSASGSLQESFLKRKKSFIQKSLERVEEIKNRERKNEKPEAKPFQRRKSEKLSRQKESFLLPGMFIWCRSRYAFSCFLISKNSFPISFIVAFAGISGMWEISGCEEFFSPFNYLFSGVKALNNLFHTCMAIRCLISVFRDLIHLWCLLIGVWKSAVEKQSPKESET